MTRRHQQMIQLDFFPSYLHERKKMYLLLKNVVKDKKCKARGGKMQSVTLKFWIQQMWAKIYNLKYVFPLGEGTRLGDANGPVTVEKEVRKMVSWIYKFNYSPMSVQMENGGWKMDTSHRLPFTIRYLRVADWPLAITNSELWMANCGLAITATRGVCFAGEKGASKDELERGCIIWWAKSFCNSFYHQMLSLRVRRLL